jgi:transcriptional regulator with XRE-family HTH domain
MEVIEMEVKDALRRFRQGAGLNQETVADKIGIKRQAYQPYETGKITPSVGTIIKIAKTFGVTTDYLLGLSDEPNQKKYDDQEVAEAFALRDALKAVMAK